jgi:hypothetical protein
MKRIKRFLRILFDFAIRLPPKDPTPYATHVPILVGLSVLCQPKRITEFGSGDFSTALFLNPSVFPSIEEVISFENDRKWFERVRASFSSERLRLQYVDADLASVVSPSSVRGDLIFIDDAINTNQRAVTVAAVARSCPRGVPVVIHDADQWRMRLVLRKFQHSYIFKVLNPQTAIAWNGAAPFKPMLAKLDHVIRRNAHQISPSDPLAWRTVIDREF